MNRYYPSSAEAMLRYRRIPLRLFLSSGCIQWEVDTCIVGFDAMKNLIDCLSFWLRVL